MDQYQLITYLGIPCTALHAISCKSVLFSASFLLALSLDYLFSIIFPSLRLPAGPSSFNSPIWQLTRTNYLFVQRLEGPRLTQRPGCAVHVIRLPDPLLGPGQSLSGFFFFYFCLPSSGFLSWKPFFIFRLLPIAATCKADCLIEPVCPVAPHQLHGTLTGKLGPAAATLRPCT